MASINDLLNRHFVLEWMSRSGSPLRLLDLGCGNQPYAHIYEPRAKCIIALDYSRRSADYRGHFLRGTAMELPFANGVFDAIICTEVLEHVPRPSELASEVARVITPGGLLIVTVPFLHGLHEIPHDYFRFTQWGLRALLEDEFEILAIEARGGSGALLVAWMSAIFSRIVWLMWRLLPSRIRPRWAKPWSIGAHVYAALWHVLRRGRIRALLNQVGLPEVLERNALGFMCAARRRTEVR